MSKRVCRLKVFALLVPMMFSIFVTKVVAYAQETAPPLSAPINSAMLQARLDKLLDAVEGVQRQITASQGEIEALSEELHEVRSQLSATNGTAHATELSQAVERLQEQSDVQQSEIKQHEQTKVESSSKYPVQISGMILFSSFLNGGVVDDIDQPALALARTGNTSRGSLAATMRQSILGVDATGPHLFGARSGGDLSVDFYGGLPYADYTTSAGVVRLRTAHAYLDWGHTSLTAFFDMPLISPRQPTSLVYQAVAPLGGSGNLWVWTPQIEFKQSAPVGRGAAMFEIGLMDTAATGIPSSQAIRQPGASQRSQQPSYEGRVSYALGETAHAVTVGAGGYYSRQKYSYGQALDAWASTADWRVPLGARAEIWGEFYRGRGIGGLGGGTYKDYYFDSRSRRVEGLDAVGGWAQLKLRMTRTLEANAAGGTDQSFAREFRDTSPGDAQNVYSTLARNSTLLGNVIYRPRAYLLFSAEYRDLVSAGATGASRNAQLLGLAAGYIF